MIYGIGTDIVHVSRMHDNITKYGDKFARRILTASEFIEYQTKHNKTAFLAKRFAAKEATAKALGTGFSNGLSLQHIGVQHDAAGKPELEFLAVAKEMIEELNIRQSHLSLADERDYAVAFVTLVL
ncbi:MAG: holo-ACP synthase [Gammaproteobacteria bacterium]|nr:holo-ACP synthase [Gammaproteobacteria bacterium]